MDLQTQINELRNELNLLKRSSTIPRDVETAFSERLRVAQSLSNSSHAVEVQGVNEAGVATYNVAKPMDGFVQTLLPGSATTIYIPYYT